MSKPVLAVIQARMGSTRLPGKVLKDIAGRPLLWHVLYRLEQCQRVDQIVVATSEAATDDAIEKYCIESGTPVVRGSESNVLARFALAVQRFDPCLIVRVNADAPLIDPEFVDHLVETVQKTGADTAFAPDGMPCVHDGVDPISRQAFDRLCTMAADDPVAVEHVTGYLKANPTFGVIAPLDIEEALQFSGARLSIDTQADIDLVETLYERANVTVGDLNLRDVVDELRADSSLLEINGHVQQKKLSQDSGTIIVRCDGGHDIGFGHVTRSLAVAQSLRDEQGYGVLFAMRKDAVANDRVAQAGFPVDIWPDDEDEGEWLEHLLSTKQPRAIVYDIRTSLSRTTVKRLKQYVSLSVLLDDGSPRRLEGDLVAYPPVPQVADLDWIDFKGTKLVGWDYVLLPTPAQQVSSPAAADGTAHVLVSMGGSDPLHLTWEVACAMSRLAVPVKPTFVIGPGFENAELLRKRITGLLPDAIILTKPDALAPHFADKDLGITMYGVTAQELAAAGVPALYVCLDEDHAYSARSLTERGVGRMLGMGDDVDWFEAVPAIEDLLSDRDELVLMRKRGPRLVDGKGAQRLAVAIAEQLALRVAA